MSYTINLTNGTNLIPGGLSDGATDNSHTSLVLIGKNYAGYGQYLNTNFVHLLENFASTSSPANPLKGQLWWDSRNNILKVYSGSGWKISTGATASPFNNPPTDLSALGGDLWLDTTNGQLKVYSGTSWILVGPAASSSAGDSGVFPVIVTDTFGGSHLIIQIRFSGINYACFSKDIFSSNLDGFPTIKAGLNFNTSISPAWGISTQDVNANPNTLVIRDSASGITVGPVTATTVSATTVSAPSISGNISVPAGGSTTLLGYATYNGQEIATLTGTGSFSSINNTIIGNSTPAAATFTNVVISTTSGLSSSGDIFPTSNIGANVGRSGNYVNNFFAKNATILSNVVPAANTGATLGLTNRYFSNLFVDTGYINNVNLSTSMVPSANLSASLGSSSRYFSGLFANSATITKLTIATDIVPTSNLVSNIGSSTNWFDTFYGKSVQAQYADLAERFEADAEYEPGTVVEIGGPAEITAVNDELSDNVFGVISTNAAYLMNAGAGSNATHPPIAVQGRVPVKVTGKISKGDRLVSAGGGIARSGKKSEITSWNVIGRALENKTTDGIGIIEAAVKLNS